MADETAVKEVVNAALMAAQAEYTELERTIVSVCQELEGDGAVSGSSVISRLRALGGRIAEHAKSTFRLNVLRALRVASTHYLMDLGKVSKGYVVPDDASADVASAIMDAADAAVRHCTPLSSRERGAGTAAVAVDGDRGSQYALKWAADHILARGHPFFLIHVRRKSTSHHHAHGKSHS